MQFGSLAGQVCPDTQRLSPLLPIAPQSWKAVPCQLKIMVTEDCDDSFVLTESVLSVALQLTISDGDGSASEGDAAHLAPRQMFRAVDGDAALALIQQHRFDLVFMDVHMPGMDGYEVIRHIRAWERHMGTGHMKIAMLSTDDLESQRLSTAGYGCVGFLRKPLQSDELWELLERLHQAEMTD